MSEQSSRVELTPVDAFDLPDWLGTQEVTWSADSGLAAGHLVRGRLSGESASHPCDLVAVDEAYPFPVAGDDVRRLTHQAWRNGEVLLVEREGRLGLACPGTGFGAERVLDALERLSRAVGGRPENVVAALRLGVAHGAVDR